MQEQTQTSHFDRAMAAIELGRTDAADKAFSAAVAEDPEDAHALGWLGYTRSFTKPAEGVTLTEQALGQRPDSAVLHWLHSVALSKLGRSREAEAVINEAARLEPNTPYIRGTQAATAYDLDKYELAVRYADAGLEVEPQNDDCLRIRAMSLALLHRHDEAISDGKRAVAINPENAHNHLGLAQAYLHSGKFDLAKHHYRESLRLDPTDDSARDGFILSLKNDYAIYRIFFHWLLLLSRVPPAARWAVVIGLLLLKNAFQAGFRHGQSWMAIPAVMILLFVVLTWAADPLFNHIVQRRLRNPVN